MPTASSALRAIVGPAPAFCADRSSHQSWLPRIGQTPSGAFRPDSAGAHSDAVDPIRHHSRAGDIVAEQDDQVRLQCVRLLRQARDALGRHPGTAGMDVGKRDDTQFNPSGQSGGVSA